MAACRTSTGCGRICAKVVARAGLSNGLGRATVSMRFLLWGRVHSAAFRLCARLQRQFFDVVLDLVLNDLRQRLRVGRRGVLGHLGLFSPHVHHERLSQLVTFRVVAHGFPSLRPGGLRRRLCRLPKDAGDDVFLPRATHLYPDVTPLVIAPNGVGPLLRLSHCRMSGGDHSAAHTVWSSRPGRALSLRRSNSARRSRRSACSHARSTLGKCAFICCEISAIAFSMSASVMTTVMG